MAGAPPRGLENLGASILTPLVHGERSEAPAYGADVAAVRPAFVADAVEVRYKSA